MDMSQVDGLYAAVRRPMGRASAPIVLALCLGVVWMAYHSLGPLCWVLFPLMLALLWMRRWRVALALLVLSPLGVFFLWGAMDYARGRAVVWTTGAPTFELFNLDPAVRCPGATSGRVVYDSEWMHHGPYNLAVRVLTFCFGKERGTYAANAYPTRQQAENVLRFRSEPALIDDLLKDQLRVGEATIKLDAGVGKALFADTDLYACWQLRTPEQRMKNELAKFGDVRVASYHTCVILRIPTGQMTNPPATQPASQPATVPTTSASTQPTTQPFQWDRAQPARIILIDPARGRPFAWYVTGETRTEPPVPWYKP